MGFLEVRELIDGFGKTSISRQSNFSVILTPFVLEQSFYTQGFKKFFQDNLLFDPYYIVFADPTTLALVSTRAIRVTPPRDDFKIQQSPLGINEYPVVSGKTASQFSITFLETESGSIKRWLSAWTQSMFPRDGTTRILSRTLQMTITTFDNSKTPVSIDVYPSIIPTTTVLPDYDMEGSESRLTVNFQRLPIYRFPKTV